MTIGVMDGIRHNGCTSFGQVANPVSWLDLLVWVDYFSKFSLSGSLECHPVGAMSESMLRVFNSSAALW